MAMQCSRIHAHIHAHCWSVRQTNIICLNEENNTLSRLDGRHLLCSVLRTRTNTQHQQRICQKNEKVVSCYVFQFAHVCCSYDLTKFDSAWRSFEFDVAEEGTRDALPFIYCILFNFIYCITIFSTFLQLIKIQQSIFLIGFIKLQFDSLKKMGLSRDLHFVCSRNSNGVHSQFVYSTWKIQIVFFFF